MNSFISHLLDRRCPAAKPGAKHWSGRCDWSAGTQEGIELVTDGTLFGWVLKIVILYASTVFRDNNSLGLNTSTLDFAN